ncbi:arylsulfatase B-like [Haliotis rufescens]|uniref:arylsulfatase B-like n=1 Tax=Haliotis rufescens TaxID=6454 RepID=UPI00201F85C6|nr:arylsulfatase B-like [Haliotis rufescens]
MEAQCITLSRSKMNLQRAVFILLTFVICECAEKPHIVFIVADDLGWNDVGFRNPQMITPNLDRLAKAGVILNSSYVQPLCSPSRNCFMSGYFPYHTGLQDSVIGIDQAKHLPANLTTIPQKLKQLGYDTHMVGKWHLGFCNWKYTPTERGFDSYLGYYNGDEDYFTHVRQLSSEEVGLDFRVNKTVKRDANGTYSANVFADRAVEIIENHDNSKPLYLYLPFQSVHVPLEVPPKYENMYKNIETIKRRVYCGMVSALDEAVGNITKALEDKGLMDNLLLVFTTDNGGPTYVAANNLPLRGAKTTLWEGGTKGTGFIYSKTLLKKTGYLNTGMMHAVDWYPTLLELAGGENTDPNMDGVSQYDMLINGGHSKRNEFVYNIYDSQEAAAIRYGDLKLMQGSPGHHNGWAPLPHLGIDERVFQADNQTFPPFMLYNITADPTEHFDLSGKYPELVDMMKKRLENWKKTRVPAQDHSHVPRANPKYYGGVWSPGWC